MVYALPSRKGGGIALSNCIRQMATSAIDDKRYRSEISDIPSAGRTATD
jgi:hypothetical protein